MEYIGSCIEKKKVNDVVQKKPKNQKKKDKQLKENEGVLKQNEV